MDEKNTFDFISRGNGFFAYSLWNAGGNTDKCFGTLGQRHCCNTGGCFGQQCIGNGKQ